MSDFSREKQFSVSFFSFTMAASQKIQTPLLFVHGAWHQPDVWESFAADFEPHFANIRLVRLPGHGKGQSAAWRTISDYVQAIKDVADGLHPRSSSSFCRYLVI